MELCKNSFVSTTCRSFAVLILILTCTSNTIQVLANPKPETAIAENTDHGNFSATDTKNIQNTVTAFLHALRHKKSENLKTLASVQMRGQFSNPADMMKLMTKIHLPIISTKGLFMHDPKMRDGYIVQSIHFISADNKPWKAAYFLVRDSEGNLGISGCHIKRMNGRFA